MLRFGLAIALLALVVDQVSKWWLLDVMARHPFGIAVTPNFNLVMVWNYGVSFGLFNSGDEGQRWILISVAAVMVGVLLVWLRRVDDRLVAGGIGLVIGGAVGNVVDRLLHGAVADFFDVHAAGWHWPAFNVADSAIVLGVGLLLIDSLFSRSEAAKRKE